MNYQERVTQWGVECFGNDLVESRLERNHRFLEESLELVQSLDCTKEEALQLVDYVYERPLGEPHQEVGGTMITLGLLCSANGLNMNDEGETELNRINDPIIKEKIRIKRQNKPEFSPLPQ